MLSNISRIIFLHTMLRGVIAQGRQKDSATAIQLYTAHLIHLTFAYLSSKNLQNLLIKIQVKCFTLKKETVIFWHHQNFFFLWSRCGNLLQNVHSASLGNHAWAPLIKESITDYTPWKFHLSGSSVSHVTVSKLRGSVMSSCISF